MSTRGISDLERGVKRSPYPDTVRRLADALGLTAPQRESLVAAARGRREDSPAPMTTLPRRGAPLVGRAAEMARVTSHLEGEGPPLLFLSGEPGIGKSRLLEEAACVAQERGSMVLSAGCARRSHLQPYAPFPDALGGFLSRTDHRRRRDLLRNAGWLVRLLPELIGDLELPLPAGGLATDQERRLLFASVSRVLAGIAEGAGALLLLDDLQWAGEDALDLLAALTDRARDDGVRIIAAFRGSEAAPGSHLAVTRADLAVAGLAAEIGLAPLASDAARELLTALAPFELSEATVDHVLQRSGGVPFYLSSYAYSISSGGEMPDVPWTASQSVQQRVAVLPAPVRDVLGAAAVIGRAVSLPLLREVSRTDEETFTSVLDAVYRARLLEQVDVGKARFVHDVVRDVVEAELSGATRAFLHRRIAEALEGADPELHAADLSWHLEGCGELAAAARYAALAGEKARAALAHREATDEFERAARLYEATGDREEHARALESLGGALLARSLLDRAMEVLERAVTAYRECGDRSGEGRATALLGWAGFYAGRAAEVLPRVRSVADSFRPLGTSEALCSLDIVLTLLLFGPEPEEGLHAGERAVAMASELGRDDLLVQAEVRRGLALGSVGRWLDGAEALEAILPLAEHIGDLQRLAEGAVFSGIGYRVSGHFQRALDLFTRGVEYAERLGVPGNLAYNLHRRGSVLFRMGRWEEARAEFERAYETDHSGPTNTFSHEYVASLMLLAALEGQDDDAARYALDTRVTDPVVPLQDVHSYVVPVLAQSKLLRGDAEGAYRELTPLLGRIEDGTLAGAEVGPVAAEILWKTGRREEALRFLSRVEEITGAHGVAEISVDAARVRGTVTAEMGEEFDCIFARALDGARALPYPLLEGRILRDWGHAALRCGDGPAAEERLHDALRIFDRLGAVRDADAVLSLLAAPLEDKQAYREVS